jgi:alpha-ketoglutarate-dependent 2,4-dichlorophenoxyacetate dioxygenase
MTITFGQLSTHFVGEVTSPIELRSLEDEATLEEIRAGMDRFGVLVFHNQSFTDEEELAFAARLDGELNRNRVFTAKGRFNSDALIDVSNVDDGGNILDTESKKRMYNLGNMLWHADASFNSPRGRYSLLHARVVPEVGGDTEFCDLRAAYDALPESLKEQIEGLEAHHSVLHSRAYLGFEDFTDEEKQNLAGAVHPLVDTLPYGRKTLYIASHASKIVGWPVADGRLLLLELRDQAVQKEFRYTHQWAVGDLVIWDNRCTMHRGLPYEDTRYRRELRRVTTLDVPLARPEAIPVAAQTS